MTAHTLSTLFIWTKDEIRIILIMTLTLALLLFDTSTLPIALPSIQSDLGSGWPWLQWVINAYFVTMTCTITAGGRLTDLFGNRRVYCLSMILYAFGAFICSLAHGTSLLIIGRMLQGVGSAMAWPSLMSILTEYFPLSKRGKALGLITALSAFLIMVGPIVGGALTQFLSWRALFILIASVALFTSIVCRLAVKKGSRLNESFDVFGFLCIFFVVLTFTSGAMLYKLFSWRSWEISALFFISFTTLTSYRFIRKKITHPLLDFSIFRKKSFLSGVFLALCAQIIQSVLLYWAIFMQKNLLFSPVKAGCFVIFSSIPMLLLSPLSGMISDRAGPKTPVIMGFLCTLLGIAIIWLYSIYHYFFLFICALFVYGLGPALFLAPIATYSLIDIEEKKHGISYAVYNAFRFLGTIFGIAMMGNMNNFFRLNWFEEKLMHYPELSTFDPKFIVRCLSWVNREELLPVPKATIDKLREAYHAVSVDALNAMNCVPAVVAILGVICASIFLKPYNRVNKTNSKRAQKTILAEVHW